MNDLTRTAFGTWNGGRFMHFGEQLSEAQFIELTQRSYEKGIRTFVTADVYGAGRADSILGEALKGIDRSTYTIVGTIGHDFYEGVRQGAKGYPRFTEPSLRQAKDYASYLKMATERSLERCGVEKFDLVMLHNPDEIGYTNETVWEGMNALKGHQLTSQLGIAPGPANGFTLDIIHCFEKFGSSIDWAMLILNPFEPWPGSLALPAAEKFDVKVLARVVDYGGIFHDDVKPGHKFRDGDHRTYRGPDWIGHGCEKLEKIRPIAEKHGLTMLQLASLWDLGQPAVKCVVPTLIQEAGEDAKDIYAKIDELANLPETNPLTAEEIATIQQIGDNTGCMALKGANARHNGQESRPDEWGLRDDLIDVANRWGLTPDWAY